MEQFKRFSKPKDSPKPQPLPFSEGRYGFGAQFLLTHKVKGTDYRIGDRFTYISQTEAVGHNPYILKIGDGIGEHCFLDPNGRAVVLSADVGVVDTLFEHVAPAPKTVTISEGEEWTPPPTPPVYITESQFTEFRKGLATVLSEIAAIVPKQGEQGIRGERGERGEKGERGETGWNGWPGDKGEQGVQGEKGEKGDKGERGEKGEQGEQGIQGPKGDKGDKGERGEKGEKGDRGERGEVGARGAKGEKGDKGDKGEHGVQGPAGKDGKDGKNGKDGKDGKAGRVGEKGLKGDKGEKGDRGEKGEQGDSGLLSAKFPLVYDAQEKSVAIDEARLDKILNKIIGGKKLSPADTGWLASTGGGGKVEIFYNGTKITPDVRGINFIGSAVESVTKVGGKVTVKLIGGVSSVNGLTGDINLTIAGAGGKQYYLNPTTPSAVNGYRQLGETPYIGGGTSATTTLTIANQWVLLNQFITDAGQPNESFLPGGNWDIDLFANSNASSNEVKFYMDVWLYNNTTGATTALANSQNAPTFINEPNITRSYNNSVYIQPRTLNTSDRIIVRLYAATTKNQTHHFTTHYEDSTISHLHTTFPAAVFPNYVSSFNGLTGDVQGVSSVNGATGDVDVVGGTDISVSTAGKTLTINYTGSGGGGGGGTNVVTSFNGLTGAVQGVSAAVAGSYITVSAATGSVTITNTGVQTFNGLTGTIQGVSSWNGQTGAVSFVNYVESFNGNTGTVQGVSAAVAGIGISVSAATGSVTITNTGVQSFNGRTGAVQGVSSAAAGTGISISAATGAITITNTGVQTFNGLTGAVTGVTVGGANTFTALNSFNAGISAAGITVGSKLFLGADPSGYSQIKALPDDSNGGMYVYMPVGRIGDINNHWGNGIQIGVFGDEQRIVMGDIQGVANNTTVEINDGAGSITLNGGVFVNAISSGNLTSTGNVKFGAASAFVSSESTTLGTTAANQNIGSVEINDGIGVVDTNRSVEFFVQASHSSGYEALKIMVIHDGTNTYNTQYGLIRTGSSLCSSYTTTITTDGGGTKNLRLRATPTNTNTTFKVVQTVIPA